MTRKRYCNESLYTCIDSSNVYYFLAKVEELLPYTFISQFKLHYIADHYKIVCNDNLLCLQKCPYSLDNDYLY